tara:strand:+ start:200 stop:376 length:177 start_codon:yes stop_codon:yes gene_type:complete
MSEKEILKQLNKIYMLMEGEIFYVYNEDIPNLQYDYDNNKMLEGIKQAIKLLKNQGIK